MRLSTISKNLFKKFIPVKPLHVLIVDRFTHNPPDLGRWNLNNKQMTDIKIDLNNYDHCGTCSLEKEYSK